jgi:hydrogenase maturation factor
MPSHHTYRRTLAENVDTKEFEAMAREYHQQSGKAGYQVVAMDGKVVRGTIDLD